MTTPLEAAVDALVEVPSRIKGPYAIVRSAFELPRTWHYELTPKGFALVLWLDGMYWTAPGWLEPEEDHR